MVAWQVKFVLEAETDLKNFDAIARERVIKKLDWLQTNFDQVKPLALTGVWAGFFKIRVSDYRIIYKIDYVDNRLLIAKIGHRSEIYQHAR